ncbi:MAG: hypothetical protein Q9170_001669 [Blastenia crenularia]
MGCLLHSPRLSVLRDCLRIRPYSHNVLQPRKQKGAISGTRLLYDSAHDPNFTSVVDNPPDLVRTGKRHGPGIIILVEHVPALIPITAFALGTWQVFRLGWKTELIAKFEDRLIRPPLPLPPRIDPDAVKDFDYRKVYAKGRLRHDQEMLIGPRLHDGNDGYLVITPLQREDGSSTVLVNRGWIPKSRKAKMDREAGLPTGPVTVEGLLREPWKKNLFTPENRPDLGQFYFPDVQQMAALTGSDSLLTYSKPTTAKRRAFPSADLPR